MQKKWVNLKKKLTGRELKSLPHVSETYITFLSTEILFMNHLIHLERRKSIFT